MSKKSVDKEFYPKAERMMLSGMGQFQIVEELSKEYYDRKRVSLLVDQMVHPEDRERVSKEKKILFILAIVLLLFSLLGVLLKNFYPEVALIADYNLESWFYLNSEPIVALLLAFEALPSRRNVQIQHKSYMFFAGLMIFNNISDILNYQDAFKIIAIVEEAIWISVLVLSIKWFRAEKKRGAL